MVKIIKFTGLLIVSLSFVTFNQHAFAQSVVKVKEINSQARFESVDDNDVIAFNNKVIGSISDNELGNEIFVSDGTQAGTGLLLDLNPGPRGSNGDDYVVFNNFVYFAATTESLGEELWRTDGTVAGTTLVADLMPGTASGRVGDLTVSGNKLIFRGTSPGIGNEFCLLDPSINPFPVCKDLNPTGDSSPGDFKTVAASVFFSADDGVHGRELFRTNGSIAGTNFVKDINPGPIGSFPRGFTLTPAGNAFVFSANDGVVGEELWISNGTEVGTELFTDINTGPADSRPEGFTAFNDGFVYFSAFDDTNGIELWRTSGIAGNTSLVANINPGLNGSSPRSLTVLNGVLYFSATRDDVGEELFFSDGSAPGTGVLKDINPGEASSSPRRLIAIDNKIFFGATTAATGDEPWVSDGSTNGTFQLIDFQPQNANSDVEVIVNFKNKALFCVEDNLTGSSSDVFISSDGSSAGTTVDFRLLRPGTDSARISEIASIGTRLLFRAHDGLVGEELFVTDGSAEGTSLVKDIIPGQLSSDIFTIRSIGSKVLFDTVQGLFDPSANGLVTRKLFVSDGSSSGTNEIFTFTNHFFGGDLLQSARIENKLVFSAALNADQGFEPWVSDGTAAGTILLKDIVPSGTPQGSNPQGFTAVGNQVYFTAAGGLFSNLWITDGTSVGTRKVSDLVLSPTFGVSPEFLGLNGATFFRAFDPTLGAELFKSDGTATGTTIVKDIHTSGSSSPELMGILNQFLIFNAATQNEGRELWRSDGTEAGTVLVKNITPGFPSTVFDFSSQAVNYNGKLYFAIEIGGESIDLWSTDGTEAGTVFVAKIKDRHTFTPFQFAVFDNKIFFPGSDNNSGNELWASDGTTNGTGRFADIAPGPANSNPSNFTPLGDILVFSATDRVNGEELYALIAANDQCPDDINKSEPGICGCGISDTDADNNGLIDCVIPTPTATPEILPGTPTLKVKKNKLLFTLPEAIGASYEIFIKNKKGKLVKTVIVNTVDGVIKKLKAGRYTFSYRILSGEIVSQNSTEVAFKIRKKKKR